MSEELKQEIIKEQEIERCPEELEEFNTISVDGKEEEEAPREGFFKRNKMLTGYLLGVGVTFVLVVGMFLMMLFGLGRIGGQMVIDQNGVSLIYASGLLDSAMMNKINLIFEGYIRNDYYEKYDVETLKESMLDGLMAGLKDPYSVYYTKEEYDDWMTSSSGEYYGIGAGLQQDPETMKVTITKVYANTPAEEAGLKDGDVIVTVGGIDATSMEVSLLVKEIKGESGTKVHMVIYRESTGETLEFDVERRKVVLPSVEGEILQGGIGYIQVSGFEGNTDEQFAAMIADFQKQGIKGLMIDLRANPGGRLDTVVNMLDYVLPEGRITYIDYKNEYRQDEVYNSDAKCVDLPIVVLIDENSASASEIFAGALQDHKYATLVGKNTFGKGIVQTIVGLGTGDAIKYTTAKYYTPNGNYIHGVGIAPDVEVDYVYTGAENEEYDKMFDSQFLKALEVMQEKLAQ